MKVYLNSIEITTEILPSDTPTLDESLEVFSFALLSNTNQYPIAPMQPVKIVMDNNDEVLFVTSTDSVEIFSMNPLRYKHTVTCTQNTRELSKHEVRNTVITQPPRLGQYAYLPFSMVKYYHNLSGLGETQELVYYRADQTLPATPPYITGVPLSLNRKEKIKNASIIIESQMWVTFEENASSDYRYRADIHTDYKTMAEFLSYAPADNNAFDLDLSVIGVYFKYQGDNTEYLQFTLDEVMDAAGDVFNNQIDITKKILSLNTNNLIEIIIKIDERTANNYDYFLKVNGVHGGWGIGAMVFAAFQIKLVCDTYYYTCYDALELLLERQKQSFSTNINVGGTTVEKAPLFALPTDTDDETYKALTTTYAPNLYFTQNTMYECIADVFRVFDAIFTMDDNKVLHIDYFNRKTDNITATIKKVGYNSYLGEENYANEFISYYQDARIIESFPANNSFGPLRSTNLGVPDTTDHYFVTPHDIDKIIKVEVIAEENTIQENDDPGSRVVHSLAPNGNLVRFWLKGDLIVDVTPYVITQELWSSLPKGRTGPFNPRVLWQNNTIYFAEGDNKIACAYSFSGWLNVTIHAYNKMVACAYYRMIGQTSIDGSVSRVCDNIAPNWSTLKMRVTYLSTVDGKVKVHSLNKKYDGSMIVDQANGAVDINKLGLNILGLVLKNGEPTMQVAASITNWDDRIKPSQYLDLGADGVWIANTVSYTIINGDKLQQKVAFVKNFNALALRTRLLRERRMTNISSNLVTKSEDVISSYIYFTANKDSAFDYLYEATPFKNDALANSLYLSFKKDLSVNLSIDFATLYSADASKHIYIPLIRYGAGNTINFEMSYDHPINAGNQTVYKSGDTWAGTNKYYTNAVYYADEDGFMDECSIYIVGKHDYVFSENFPEITEILYPTDQIVGIGEYKVYKQPNEIFALNYQLVFLGYNFANDIVGSAFINDNFFIDGVQKDRQLKIFGSFDKYTPLDIKGKGESKRITTVLVNNSLPNYVEISFIHPPLAISFDVYSSWAVCDENDNILFAFNTSNSALSPSHTIYFTSRNKRN